VNASNRHVKMRQKKYFFCLARHGIEESFELDFRLNFSSNPENIN